MENFELKIIGQYWVDKNPENIDDTCSHGEIFFKINNTVISEKEDGEWSISTFALNLLRTIEKDHLISDNYPMIDHCGGILMMGCPISINWNIEHQNSSVLISDIQKFPTTDSEEVINYKGLKIELNLSDYKKIVVEISPQVKHFFDINEIRNIQDEDEKLEYNNFWNEFNFLFNKYK